MGAVRESIDPQSRVALDEALAGVPGGLFNDPDLSRRRANYSSDVALVRASLPPDDRYSTGGQKPGTSGIGYQIVDKDHNMPTTDHLVVLKDGKPIDYPAQYKAAWAAAS